MLSLRLRKKPELTGQSPAELELDAALAGDRVTGEELIAATSLDVSPVSPGLFEAVTRYAELLDRGERSLSDKVKRDHPLWCFGELFWAELVCAVYDWRRDRLPNVRTAVRMQMRHEAKYTTRSEGHALWQKDLGRLVDNLVDYLHETRDTYWRDGDEIRRPDDARQLGRLVLDICEDTAKWARAVGLTDLALAAEEAREALFVSV